MTSLQFTLYVYYSQAFCSCALRLTEKHAELTEFEREVDAVGPLYVGQHRARLPPAERLGAVKVRQVAGRVGLGGVRLVANVARLGRPRDAGLLAEVLGAGETARVGRVDREVEGGVDERREAALRPAAAVVARPLVGVVGPGRGRSLAGAGRQQPDDEHDHGAENRRHRTRIDTRTASVGRARAERSRHPPVRDELVTTARVHSKYSSSNSSST